MEDFYGGFKMGSFRFTKKQKSIYLFAVIFRVLIVLQFSKRAYSSAWLERYTDNVEVAGSSPAKPTLKLDLGD